MLQDNAGNNNSSVNTASRGRGGSPGRGRGSPRRGFAGRGSGNPPTFQKTGGQLGAKPTCQVCKKKGHEADVCWHRFEEDLHPYINNAGAA
jgi:hypothetical protein